MTITAFELQSRLLEGGELSEDDVEYLKEAAEGQNLEIKSGKLT